MGVHSGQVASEIGGHQWAGILVERRPPRRWQIFGGGCGGTGVGGVPDPYHELLLRRRRREWIGLGVIGPSAGGASHGEAAGRRGESDVLIVLMAEDGEQRDHCQDEE